MKTTIGIFQGKQAENNKYLLETLYNNGPLTAWELTKKVREKNRMSLHAIYNKRLHGLAKKGYVRKTGKYWSLQFKGIIGVLLIQSKPKPWSEKWTKLIDDYAKLLEKKSKQITNVFYQVNGKSMNPIEIVKRCPLILGKFENWVGLANEVKKLMENGVINFDVIKNKTLFAILLTQLSNDVLDIELGERSDGEKC